MTEGMVVHVVTVFVGIQAWISRWIAIQMHEEHTSNLLNLQTKQVGGSGNEIGDFNVWRHWLLILPSVPPRMGPEVAGGLTLRTRTSEANVARPQMGGLGRTPPDIAKGAYVLGALYGAPLSPQMPPQGC